MTESVLLVVVILLSLTGIFLSALSFSGTWLLFGAAVLAEFSQPNPALWTPLLFLALCIAAEVLEAIAGYQGVQQRGGSKRAGIAALLGGLIGMLIGSSILPFIGTILGLLVGSFAFAYLAEWLRLRHHQQAAHIARGAVWARLRVMFIKTSLTLAMSLWLLVELWN
jgi:uncharacterized protein YqgC (DUF456 family)